MPKSLVDAVVEAIRSRLAKITVGNPADETVRMGALASLAQRQDVRKAIESLRNFADIVFGEAQLINPSAEDGAHPSPYTCLTAAMFASAPGRNTAQSGIRVRQRSR